MKDMQTTISSPIGPLRLTVAEDGALTRVDFGAGDVSDDPRCARVTAQLDEYFAGQRTAFDLVLRPQGSPFEQLVWAELLRIPYRCLARAWGRANARNPIAIVCPCHRVIGSDGSLTGYAGGLESKRTLLALESGALSLL
jgi:methylated-DNA-[protein]-cysteine S-methyltransferase